MILKGGLKREHNVFQRIGSNSAVVVPSVRKFVIPLSEGWWFSPETAVSSTEFLNLRHRYK